MSGLALFRAFPGLEEAIPRISIGDYPTPVHRLHDVAGAEYGNIWVKRDDLTHAQYGGNKVRKLEFILANAQRAGAQRLITVGAAGSHHALATAVHGGNLGFKVTLVLFPQRVTEHMRTVLLSDVAFGATLRFTPRMESVPLALWRARLVTRESAHVIPPGGSDSSGTLGYVSAALELLEQVERGELPMPEVVHVAAGTLGTSVGLAIGFALARVPVRIVASRITSWLVANERAVAKLARETLEVLSRAGAPVPPLEDVLSRLELHDRQLGEGYGRSTPAGDAAARTIGSFGLTLDGTYTAKAAAELLASAAREPTRNHLFWHTLGRPPALPSDTAALEEKLPPAFRALLARG
jgi:1-aminocyclopropane-1-carboxylate deaminase/D-cysteine desulfhydrase-like pyridoxal-dependent ACC family enzyme